MIYCEKYDLRRDCLRLLDEAVQNKNWSVNSLENGLTNDVDEGVLASRGVVEGKDPSQGLDAALCSPQGSSPIAG